MFQIDIFVCHLLFQIPSFMSHLSFQIATFTCLTSASNFSFCLIVGLSKIQLGQQICLWTQQNKYFKDSWSWKGPFKGCFKTVLKVLEKVSRKCQTFVRKFSKKNFQRCFMNVSLKFWFAIFLLHGSHRSYPSWRRACLDRGLIFWIRLKVDHDGSLSFNQTRKFRSVLIERVSQWLILQDLTLLHS